MTTLPLSHVAVQFGATKLSSDITFPIAARERWGIIGRNGTGKTTLFKLITGDMQPTKGVIARQPGLRVALLEQHRDFGDAKTVWEAAAGQFAELLALEQSLADQATRMGELGDRFGAEVGLKTFLYHRLAGDLAQIWVQHLLIEGERRRAASTPACISRSDASIIVELFHPPRSAFNVPRYISQPPTMTADPTAKSTIR